MIGIDWLSVPCSRFTTLNAVELPASDQHSSETISRNTATATMTRRHAALRLGSIRTGARTSVIAPHT